MSQALKEGQTFTYTTTYPGHEGEQVEATISYIPSVGNITVDTKFGQHELTRTQVLEALDAPVKVVSNKLGRS